MKVLKFGGTSVGSSQRIVSVIDLVKDESPKIVVLSAMSGTTNALVEIINSVQDGKLEIAQSLVKNLAENYGKVVDSLYDTFIYRSKANSFIAERFNFLNIIIAEQTNTSYSKQILAIGEELSSQLFITKLDELGIKAKLISALDFLYIDENEEPDMNKTERLLRETLLINQEFKLFVTQGFICRNHLTEIDNLKRGGSDYSASIIGAAINASEIQIWTDIDGMHNNDPRIVDKTYPISELSFDEAAELAYFGAKILHPATVLPAKNKNIPVRILNTMKPEAEGTIITARSSGQNYKAVAAKDGITAIKIKSGRMLMAYGFLRSIFEVFEKYKTPIDMITTSEVAVSMTIDNTNKLPEILNELKEYGLVETDTNQTIVCIVGDFTAEKNGYALQVLESLKEIPIRMISYGGSKNNISVLINSANKKAALQSINNNLFFNNR